MGDDDLKKPPKRRIDSEVPFFIRFTRLSLS